MSNKITTGLMSSNSVEWATPWDLFNHLDSEFHFTLDVCASEGLQKCDRYFTPEIDGLSQSWDNEYATVYHSTANRRELLEILHGWVNKRLEDNIEVARLIDYLNGGNEDDLHNIQ